MCRRNGVLASFQSRRQSILCKRVQILSVWTLVVSSCGLSEPTFAVGAGRPAVIDHQTNLHHCVGGEVGICVPAEAELEVAGGIGRARVDELHCCDRRVGVEGLLLCCGRCRSKQQHEDQQGEAVLANPFCVQDQILSLLLNCQERLLARNHSGLVFVDEFVNRNQPSIT